MTQEELAKTPFKCVCCASFENEHTMTYSALKGRLGFCVHTPKKEDGSFAKRGYTHYHIDGKVYKSKRKFLDALKDFNPIRVACKEEEKEKTCDIVEFNK